MSSEISCDERRAVWRPRMKSGEIVVGSSSTNFMGNGLIETTWVWKDSGEECLHEEVRNDSPDGWSHPDYPSTCRHWTMAAERLPPRPLQVP